MKVSHYDNLILFSRSKLKPAFEAFQAEEERLLKKKERLLQELGAHRQEQDRVIRRNENAEDDPKRKQTKEPARKSILR